MKRMSVIATALSLTLLVSISVDSRTLQGNSNTKAAKTQKKKVKGRALVTKLPMEGVEIKNGALRAKRGFKFVKKPDGTATLARMAGGGSPSASMTGSFECSCTDMSGTGGGCQLAILGPDSMVCEPNDEHPCKAGCVLDIVIRGARRGVIMY